MKFALDTNLYVRAFRDDQGARELQAFYSEHAPSISLCSVVVHELEVGSTSPEVARWVERVGRPSSRTRRVFTPSHTAWSTSGSALSRLASQRRIDRRNIPRSLVNDVLLAATCRENGITLVTANTADFEMISSVLRFDFVAPWP